MNKHSAEFIFSGLTQLLHLCKQMQNILQQDKNIFIDNKLETLEENNNKKVLLIDEINTLVLSMTDHSFLNDPHSTLADNIRKKTDTFNSAEKNKIDALLNDLKSEIEKSSGFIRTNTHIVFTSLQQMNDTWHKLLACKPNYETIYDKTGKIG